MEVICKQQTSVSIEDRSLHPVSRNASLSGALYSEISFLIEISYP